MAVAYDSVGATTFDASLASLRRRGMLVLFGAASGPVPPVDPQRLNAGGSLLPHPAEAVRLHRHPRRAARDVRRRVRRGGRRHPGRARSATGTRSPRPAPRTRTCRRAAPPASWCSLRDRGRATCSDFQDIAPARRPRTVARRIAAGHHRGRRPTPTAPGLPPGAVGGRSRPAATARRLTRGAAGESAPAFLPGRRACCSPRPARTPRRSTPDRRARGAVVPAAPAARRTSSARGPAAIARPGGGARRGHRASSRR